MTGNVSYSMMVSLDGLIDGPLDDTVPAHRTIIVCGLGGRHDYT